MALDDILPNNDLSKPLVTEAYRLRDFDKDDLTYRSVVPTPVPTSIQAGEAYGIVVKDLADNIVRRYISFRDRLDGGCDTIPGLNTLEYE